VTAKPVAPKPVVPQVIYKCPFPADELVKWRQILLAKRHEVTDDIAGLVKDAMDAEDGHTTPNHIAERGSDADLQDLSLGVAGEEKDVVWQIDRALRKIDANRPIPFGLCEHTKEAIPRTRLQLIPWTPLSIEGATHMEQQSLTLEDLLIED
jgi:RNA polymerase-binding transcription factor DksA